MDFAVAAADAATKADVDAIADRNAQRVGDLEGLGRFQGFVKRGRRGQ